MHTHIHKYSQTRNTCARTSHVSVVRVTNTFANGKSHLGVHVNHFDDVDYGDDDDDGDDENPARPPKSSSSLPLPPSCRFACIDSLHRYQLSTSR